MMVFIFILSVVLLVMLPEAQRYLLIPVIITMMLYHYKSTKTNNPTGESNTGGESNPTGENVDINNTQDMAPNTIITVAPTDVYDRADAMPYADANVDSGAAPPHDEQQHWMQNERHTTCYKPPPSLEQLNDCDYQAHLPYDEACARMARLRKRDKQAIDGAVSKNANYFKKHYGDELDREESKPWWGNDAY